VLRRCWLRPRIQQEIPRQEVANYVAARSGLVDESGHRLVVRNGFLPETFVVGEFTQFVFDIEQPPEVSHRRGGLCGRTERMQFLELATRMCMAAGDPDSPLRIGTQQFVADVRVGDERALEVRKEPDRAGTRTTFGERERRAGKPLPSPTR